MFVVGKGGGEGEFGAGDGVATDEGVYVAFVGFC